MRTRVQKWGNSLAIRIPYALAQELGVAQGSEVDLSLQDESLLLKPIRQRQYSLSDLLEKVTDENLHREVSSGEAVGREVW